MREESQRERRIDEGELKETCKAISLTTPSFQAKIVCNTIYKRPSMYVRE